LTTMFCSSPECSAPGLEGAASWLPMLACRVPPQLRCCCCAWGRAALLLPLLCLLLLQAGQQWGAAYGMVLSHGR
jgi:hypothetical protein